ncbi:MAG: ACP S-malonyltransferase [Phycisphaerae bacterium]|nr:ACP S-malonyltransferase [Phycisphaerae bacterium]
MTDAAKDIAFVFPGQGAQHVGMGRDVYEALAPARAVFDRAEQVTGLELTKLCFEGPGEQLSRTDVAQPAIFTVSAAMLASLGGQLDPPRVAALKPRWMAGLSLGEYTALFAAGMIDFDSALKLVTLRGRAMQDAATGSPGGMVAVMGLDEGPAEQLCRAAAEGQELTCANFNCPGQIVLSGERAACERAAEMSEQFGAKGAKLLDVAGAFHSGFMAPAADELAKALAAVSFRAPQAGPEIARDAPAAPQVAQQFADVDAAVIANVDARPYADAGEVPGKLLRQLTSPIRWQQSMAFAVEQGARRFYEIGPGKVLRGLLRRIDRNVECTCVNGLDAVEKLTAE